MALNGPAYFAAAYLLLDRTYHGWMGLLAVSVAAVHLYTARRLLEKEPRTALLALGLGAAFITIAIPVQFSGYTITIAWAIEAAALAWIASRFEQPRAAWVALGILGLVLIRLAVFDRHAATARLITFGASAVAFWLVAKWMTRGKPALAVYIIGHAVLLWGLEHGNRKLGASHGCAAKRGSVTTAGISIMLAAYAVAMIGAGVLTTTADEPAAGSRADRHRDRKTIPL